MIHAFWTLRDEFDWNNVQTCGVTLVLDERLFDLRMQSRPSSNFLSQPAVNATDNFQYPSINASTAGEMEVKNYSLKTRQQLISLFVFVFFRYIHSAWNTWTAPYGDEMFLTSDNADMMVLGFEEGEK